MSRVQQLLIETGSRHHAAGNLGEAEKAYTQALAYGPTPDLLHKLAYLRHQQGRHDEALSLVPQALALKPAPEIHLSHGNVLAHVGRTDEAITAYRAALALRPAPAVAAAVHSNLGGALQRLALHAEAMAEYDAALALNPRDPKAHANAIGLLNYTDGADPAAVFAAHRKWADLHANPLPPTGPPHDPRRRDPDTPVRIGYVSADLRRHSVAFVEPLFARHDRSRFQIFVYADVPAPDAVTDRLRSYPATWRSLVGLSDEAAARLIHADRVDLLVDLSGHTGGNRLLAFARRPAPIQLTYLGYPNTTGMRAMDYRLTDAVADPPGVTDRYHTEELLRIPGGAWCFAGAAAPPDGGRGAGRAGGGVTFASFNTLAKLTPGTLDAWAQILARVPGSRLLLKAAGVQIASVQERICAAFAAQGVARDRLEFLPAGLPYDQHLALYRRVDLALDPFPYNGTTTTLEALTQGVPVLTLTGRVHAARVGTSLLTAAGLPELIAPDVPAYVSRAAGLAADPAALAGLSAALPIKIAPLVGAGDFVARYEATLTKILEPEE